MKKFGRCFIKGVTFVLFAMAAGALCSEAGPLRVGASRIEYTQLIPPPTTPPSGKYEHEKLFIRAIVLDNGATRAVLVSIDGNAGASARGKVAEELECPIENVITSSTHSHSAGMGGPRRSRTASAQQQPAAPARGGAGIAQQQQASPMDEIILDAVRQAVANLQPARMGFGTGCPT